MNAAWYMHGFRPGEVGNAVIAGHLDSSTGGPAVFWDLGRLEPGDQVAVTYENGDRYTFQVEDKQLFDFNADESAVKTIFGESLTPDLNLITCEGVWDRSAGTYSQRLVVFTRLLDELTVHAGSAGAYD
jgi:sortase (surface protein transpeptidase)